LIYKIKGKDEVVTLLEYKTSYKKNPALNKPPPPKPHPQEETKKEKRTTL
jgi:hypothetical protein